MEARRYEQPGLDQVAKIFQRIPECTGILLDMKEVLGILSKTIGFNLSLIEPFVINAVRNMGEQAFNVKFEKEKPEKKRSRS